MGNTEKLIVFCVLMVISLNLGLISRAINRQTDVMLCLAAAQVGVLCVKAKP